MPATIVQVDQMAKDYRQPDVKDGVHILLDNGWTVSIQWSKYNYAGNGTVELWSWNEDDSRQYPSQPIGWASCDDIADFIDNVSRRAYGLGRSL